MIPRVCSVCFYPFSHLSYFPIVVLHQFSFWTTLVRTGKNLCEKIASKWAFFCKKYLAKYRAGFHGFDHNFFVLSSFLVCQLLIWRSSCALKKAKNRLTNFWRSSIAVLVKFGQTWPNLIKLGKIPPSSKRSRGLTDFNMFRWFRPVFGLVRLPCFTCWVSENCLVSKWGYDTSPIGPRAHYTIHVVECNILVSWTSYSCNYSVSIVFIHNSIYKHSFSLHK